MDERERLLHQVRRALDDGRITPADLLAVIGGRPARSGIAAARVLPLLGATVILLGVVLVYATAFARFAEWAQLSTPFLFPLAAFSLLATLIVRRRSALEREVCASVAFIALALAFTVAHRGAPEVDPQAWATVAAGLVAIGAGALLILHRPPLRSAALALAASLAGGANFAAAWAGMPDGGYRWLQLVLAAGCAGAGLALRRRDPLGSSLFFAGATALTLIGAVLGISSGMNEDVTGLSGWHALLSATVAAITVGAAASGQPLLWATAGLSALVWLSFTVPVAGSSVGWALAVVGMGVALVAVGGIASRVARRRARRVQATGSRGSGG